MAVARCGLERSSARSSSPWGSPFGAHVLVLFYHLIPLVASCGGAERRFGEELATWTSEPAWLDAEHLYAVIEERHRRACMRI